jgi:hypothetical protein
MKKLIVVVISFVVLLSCDNTNKNVEPVPGKPELVFPATIDVDGARSNNEIPLLSEFADDISYIKLKTPPNTLLTGGRIFILSTPLMWTPLKYVYQRSKCSI